VLRFSVRRLDHVCFIFLAISQLFLTVSNHMACGQALQAIDFDRSVLIDPRFFKVVRSSLFFRILVPEWLKSVKKQWYSRVRRSPYYAVFRGAVFTGTEPIVVHKYNSLRDFNEIIQARLFPYTRCGTF
jgi:hypothetical protein